MGHVDGRLGRAVQVVQARLRQLGEHLLLGIGRQRFATADDARKARAARHAAVLQERLEHRRHEVQRGDVFAGDQLDQAGRVAVITGAATTSRAPVIKGQKNSHTDTSKLNGVFCNTLSRASSR